MKYELKPCPFCGEKATLFQIPENTKQELSLHPRRRWKHPGMWAVGCTGDNTCLGNIDHVTRLFSMAKYAADAWNARSEIKWNPIRSEEPMKFPCITIDSAGKYRLTDGICTAVLGKEFRIYDDVYEAEFRKTARDLQKLLEIPYLVWWKPLSKPPKMEGKPTIERSEIK